MKMKKLDKCVYQITMILYPPGLSRKRVTESLEILEEIFEMRSIPGKEAKALGAAAVELGLTYRLPSTGHFMFESRIEETLNQLSKASPVGYNTAVAEIDPDA